MNTATLRILLLPVLALGGCLANRSGAVTSDRTGDVSNPAATRTEAALELQRECETGPDVTPSAGSLRRQPYLMQVTTTSASVLYTGAALPSTVAVTLPDGTPVGQFPAEIDPAGTDKVARQQIARLEGLEPEAIYCYEVRDEADLPLTRRTGFRTAPLAGSEAAVRFAAFGDSGSGGEDQIAVARQLGSVPLDLILVAGDIAYDGATRELLDERFFDIYQPLLRNFPVFPVSGNHEYDSTDAEPFREVFALPENGGANGRERWYSYDYGDVHFIGLDSEKVNAEQAAWLEADLAASKQPWKIAILHRPPYSSGEHGSELSVRERFDPIFERHGVQLVLAGHDHHYERTKPQNGVTYVVTGGGGAGVRDTGASDFTAFSDAVLHFVYVEIQGDTLALHAIDASGREFDSTMIRR